MLQLGDGACVLLLCCAMSIDLLRYAVLQPRSLVGMRYGTMLRDRVCVANADTG